jgi:hypothetical protein
MVKEETRQEEKKDIQLDIEEKPQPKRRIWMIIIAIILALSIIIVPTAYFVLTSRSNCPYTKQDCINPRVIEYWNWQRRRCEVCE